jgi:hypothetical protein
MGTGGLKKVWRTPRDVPDVDVLRTVQQLCILKRLSLHCCVMSTGTLPGAVAAEVLVRRRAFWATQALRRYEYSYVRGRGISTVAALWRTAEDVGTAKFEGA